MILMCTDGLSNMVEDEELFPYCAGKPRDIVEAGQMLMKKAKRMAEQIISGVILSEPFADEVSI